MAKLLFYCTKSKWQLFKDIITGKWLIDKIKNNKAVNGKIVAECDYEVEEIYFKELCGDDFYETATLTRKQLIEKSCLSRIELFNYLGMEKNGYAIHIKNLYIFDEPKELSEVYRPVGKYKQFVSRVKKAPQNMMYVDVYENEQWFKYILISIRPQWLCKILNGEKTIEVRKKVLKEMLK